MYPNTIMMLLPALYLQWILWLLTAPLAANCSLGSSYGDQEAYKPAGIET